MILVDSAVGSRELQPLIAKQGIHCSTTHLDFADAMFEGFSPDGLSAIGVERKRIQDMIQCIDDGRYTGHQRIGMNDAYQFRFLIIEGYWKPDMKTGILLEGHPKSDGTLYWSSDRPGGGKHVKYAKLRRYLFSVSLAGVVVMYARDVAQTAFDICELYHYFQKPWHEHTSLLEMHRPMLRTLGGKPSLVREWARDLPGVGTELSQEAERVFRTPIRLATGDETDWVKIPGVGVGTAQKIVRAILGER